MGKRETNWISGLGSAAWGEQLPSRVDSSTGEQAAKLWAEWTTMRLTPVLVDSPWNRINEAKRSTRRSIIQNQLGITLTLLPGSYISTIMGKPISHQPSRKNGVCGLRQNWTLKLSSFPQKRTSQSLRSSRSHFEPLHGPYLLNRRNV